MAGLKHSLLSDGISCSLDSTHGCSASLVEKIDADFVVDVLTNVIAQC